MKKLVLLSVIIMAIAIPARAARAKDGRAGLKKALIQMTVFDFVYMFLLLYVWPRLH
jgi:hypothetical protein